MAIQDKATLTAEIAAAFPDNNSGEITPADLRAYLTNILDSNNLQRIETVFLLTASESLTIADIDENKLYVMGALGQVVQLPALSPGIDTIRTTLIKPTNDLTSFVVTGGDNYFGPLTFDRDGEITIIATAAGWFAFFNAFAEDEFINLTDTPSTYAGQANKHVTVNGAEDGLEFIDLAGTPDFASAFFEESANTTTINNVDVWETINQNITLGDGNDFSAAGMQLTYDGADPKTFAYGITVTGQKAGGGTVIYEYALALNGTAISPFVGITLNNSDDVACSVQGVVDVVQNDTLEVQVRSRSGSNDVDVRDMNLLVTEL